ncbi:MAG: ABC transporter ATP-binding protein [Alphaproteobacteria bacterium]|nr:ABC transporter ATP-binding protein [Alphaproteobacteria bacterium]
MADCVIVDGLVKRYGWRVAVRGVSFAIGEGEVVGLLGPNGSGKTTILRVLGGYLPATTGTVQIAGIDVAADSLAARSRIGYVAEDAPLYDGMRVGEFLHFMAAIKGVPGYKAHNAVAMAAKQVDLSAVLALPIGRLSRGYRQRVAIAQALLGDPPLLMLDEPTNALDAYQVIAVRKLIRSLAGQRTVLVASHVLGEIERIASRVMILLDGCLLTTDAMREAGHARQLRLRIAGPASEVLRALRQIPSVVAAASEPGEIGDGYLVELAPTQPVSELARALIGQGFALSELTDVKRDLEGVFLNLTRRAGIVEAEAP